MSGPTSDQGSRRQSVREWVAIAEDDLWMVTAALAAKPPIIYPALFHAQQCAEKYLKALLVWQDVRFPRTHDLKVLLEFCLPFDPDLIALQPACFRLSEYGVEPRYPMPGPDIDLDQAREAAADAEAVREAIRALMPEALDEE